MATYWKWYGTSIKYFTPGRIYKMDATGWCLDDKKRACQPNVGHPDWSQVYKKDYEAQNQNILENTQHVERPINPKKMDKNLTYVVMRMGHTTDRVTQGKEYEVYWQEHDMYGSRWVCTKCDKKGYTTQPTLANPKYWKVLRLAHQPDEEIPYDGPCTDPTEIFEEPLKEVPLLEESKMSEIKTGATLIDGNDADNFTETNLIEHIQRQQKAMHKLEEMKLPDSKWVKTNIATHAANISKLVAILDKRVEEQGDAPK